MLTKKLDNTDYEIIEISTTDGFKLMNLFANKDENANIELLKACVKLNGEPIDTDKVPFKHSIKLIEAAMEVNGFEEGKS